MNATNKTHGGPPVRALTLKVMSTSTSIAQEIACRDFGKKTVNLLSKKGVQFIGTQAASLLKGDIYFGDTVYSVLIGGQVSAVRTYRQLLAMASSSWTASEYLAA